MISERTRKFFLISSLLLFPVTLYYFSPALIFNAGLHGVINGSFVVFLLLFLLSIPFGRLFCSYLCPAGGLQECLVEINSKAIKKSWKQNIKYIIWFIWITGVVLCYVFSNHSISFNFFFETEKGISVRDMQSYIIYYGIILLIFIPSVVLGKRAFCHYFCWMSPFMILGIKIRRILKIRGLGIQVTDRNACIQCGKCNQGCPMSLDVREMVNGKGILHSQCIQCGRCVRVCPKNILAHTFGKEVIKRGKYKED